MSVHHIINSYSNHRGGAEKLVRSLHACLKHANYESKILGIEAQKDFEEEGAISLQLNSAYQLSTLWKVWRYIKKNVNTNDIVHAHLFPAIFYVSLLKQLGLIDGPVVMTEHNTSNSRRGRVLGSLIDRIMYKGFDMVYAVSRGVETELLNWRPELKTRTAIVLNGVSPTFDKVRVRKAKVCPIILSVGNLRESKNYRHMLAAIPLLEDVAFEYWIAGSGKEEQSLKKLAESLGISKKIRFMGHVSDLQPIWDQADIFLMASEWEGFGMAAIEAMNASLPLVVSDVPGLSEVVNSAQPCALCVDPNSPLAIAQGLKQLIQSPERRRALGENGFHHAKMFTLEKMTRAYINEYDALLGI